MTNEHWGSAPLLENREKWAPARIDPSFDPEIFDDSDMIATNALGTASNLPAGYSFAGGNPIGVLGTPAGNTILLVGNGQPTIPPNPPGGTAPVPILGPACNGASK